MSSLNELSVLDHQTLHKVSDVCWSFTENGNDSRKEFRELYSIPAGISVRYVTNTGSEYWINIPENPYAWDRMSFMIADILPEFKLNLYPIHDIIVNFEYLNVPPRPTEN
jgi:hypothetical protein